MCRQVTSPVTWPGPPLRRTLHFSLSWSRVGVQRGQEAGLSSPQGSPCGRLEPNVECPSVCSGCTVGQGGTFQKGGLDCPHPHPVPHLVYLQNDADPNVSEQQTFLVVVAIDFGTTSSGYAYSFTKEPECIHVMR